MVNFESWLLPWPNYFVLARALCYHPARPAKRVGQTELNSRVAFYQAPNIRFFRDHGVRGVFEEGNYRSYAGDMQAMKSYLLVKMVRVWLQLHYAQR